MKYHWKTIFKCTLIIALFLQLSRLIDRTDHYPTSSDVYCFHRKPPLGYTENKNVNDEFNIQQCSFDNIDACQHIANQSVLFRLASTAGFTSEFNNLIRGFIYAIHTHRRFLIDDQFWNYGALSSFFNISQGYFSPWLPLSKQCLKRTFVHIGNDTYIPKHIIVGRDDSGGFLLLNSIMEPFENDNQTLKIKRIVVEYLWKKLNNQIKDFINQYINEIDLDNIQYGIHIRRGDKLNDEAELIPIEKYIDGVEYFINKSATNDSKPRVYLASDEQNITEQFQYLRPDWEFVYIAQGYSQPNGHQQHIFNQLSTDIKFKLTRFLLTDLEILSRVKYVVCTFSSNVCRFVQILRKQDPDTVLSLDQEWYPQ